MLWWKKISFSLGILLIIMCSCSDGGIRLAADPEEQRAEDIQLIDEYLQKKGFEINQEDTTLSGVRGIILDTGMGTKIEEYSIVTFDYIGFLLNDTIFDTSIPEIADSIRNISGIDSTYTQFFKETRTYEPFVETYSSEEWTISQRYVAGFIDGIALTFGQMNVGGESLILIPSSLGYGAIAYSSLIPANSVLGFRLFPRKVKKQL